MIVTAEISSSRLPDLIKQVQAGDEILLTQDQMPVAKLVSVLEKEPTFSLPLRIRSLSGHRVLFPTFSQGELAEEMFGPR